MSQFSELITTGVVSNGLVEMPKLRHVFVHDEQHNGQCRQHVEYQVVEQWF